MNKILKIIAILVINVIITDIPCYCYDSTALTTLPSAKEWNIALSPDIETQDMPSIPGVKMSLIDKSLLTVDLAWSEYSEQERFNYTLKYMPLINILLGVPENTFPASNVHMMKPGDPNYSLACAYTDYGTKRIYLNMKKINDEAIGGWASVFALAHETRHLYQNAYQTLPYNSKATLINHDTYVNDPRELDANAFAEQFIAFILGSINAEKVYRK